MAAEHVGSASVAVVSWLWPGVAVGRDPRAGAEMCAAAYMRRHKYPESGDQDKRCEKTERLLSVPSAENEVRSKTLPSSPAAGQNRAEVPERIRKTSGLPSPLKLTSTTFNMTWRACNDPFKHG